MPDRATAGSTTDQAKDVARTAADRAGDVAGEATTQAKAVVRDASQHVRELVGQSRSHLDDEARVRSRQAAGGLRTLADQLGALTSGDVQAAGALGDYARQGREQLTRLADRLEEGPSAVFDDVRRFARRQPVLFLAAAGTLGFVAGRLARGARDASHDDTGTATASYAGNGLGTAGLPPTNVASNAALPPVEATATPPTTATTPIATEDLAP